MTKWRAVFGVALLLLTIGMAAWASNLEPNRVLGKGGPVVGSKRLYTEFRYRPVTSLASGGATAGATGDTDVMMFPGECLEMPPVLLEYNILGAGQTILAPVLTANGLNIGLDQATTEGVQITPGITSRCPVAYTVGTDGGFYVEASIKVEDVSGVNPLTIGFRKAEPYQADDDTYTDFASIGILGTAGDVKTATAIGDAATVTTDTTDDAADTAVLTLRVNVSAAGVVTYQRALSATTSLATPTTTVAYTFTSGTVVVPYIFCLNAGDVGGTVELQKLDVGPL